MPFTILKISKTDEEAEVIGEFGTEVEANAFVLGVRTEDSENEYLVEAPPVPPSRKE